MWNGYLTEKRRAITLSLRKRCVNIHILMFMTSNKPEASHTTCSYLFLRIEETCQSVLADSKLWNTSLVFYYCRIFINISGASEPWWCVPAPLYLLCGLVLNFNKNKSNFKWDLRVLFACRLLETVQAKDGYLMLSLRYSEKIPFLPL